MKIFENISIGYKRIATGIAIIGFLSMMYLALIPGASFAYVYGPAGGVLSGAFVFIKEWPQYNATTSIDGSYAINNMPIGEYTLAAIGNDSYAPNVTWINVTEGNTNPHDITLSPAINYYVPFLYQRQDQIYDTALQVQNNGTKNASVEKQFYLLDGTYAGNSPFLIQQNELSSHHAFEITGTMPVFVGPAKVKSDVPVQVQGYIYTVAQGVYSIAPSTQTTTTTTYLPFLYQRSDLIYDSGVQVYNPGLEPANVTINMYNLDGTLAASVNYTVASKTELNKYVFDIVTGKSIFVGPAEIISDQPIVAQGYIRTKASNIYSIAPSVSTSVLQAYLPFLYQRSDLIYDAGVQVFNPGLGTANVTINMYNLDGSLAGSANYTVASKAELNKYVFDIVTGQSLFVGPAEIISDQPIMAQGYIRTKASNVYSIAPQVRKPVSAGSAHVPFLYSTVNITHDAGIQAMNPNEGTANVTVTLYYPNGTIAGTYSQMLASKATLNKYAFDIAPNTKDFSGSVIITADQPIVSQGYIRKKSTNIYSIAPPVER